MNKDFKESLLAPHSTILEAMSVLDSTPYQIVLVVSEFGKLMGTITDGDIRRGILKGIPTSELVDKVFNPSPVTLNVIEDIEKAYELMEAHVIKQIPILDEEGVVVGLEVSKSLFVTKKETEVVLMVGGLGTRLLPLTENCPKPMLKVGSKPILERIISQFQSQGFYKFHLAVNYMAHMVEEHFQDGSKFGVEISYIREEKSFGTAGALSLLPQRPKEAFIVMNGDLLTSMDFGKLMDFHTKSKSCMTMCVREYNFEVPYGVVKLDEFKITDIKEKPLQKFFVNSGIYVLEPEALDLVPQEERLDMPTLFHMAKEKALNISGFPLREYWLDIGQMDDFKRAEEELALHFDKE